MYIKQVIIEGFKSYREQVAPEPFSSKINCVVGPNGSGKTNFFHAIRFVLSDLYQTLRTEDRQSLLHEGTGGQVITAYVELVFDNSDNRLPVDKEEVRLRRVIGTRKDEYYLDKKHINKSEVMNLLESAGFSRSNPYYVVQQGKIMQLSLMKDSERLSLLKEIGGAVVYEDRRRESLKLMEDAESRRRQIVDVVSFIEARLKELDEEKEELRQYQTLDKQRRALEYTIFEKELQDCKDQLDKVEAARAAVQEKSREVAASAQERHDEAKRVDKELKAMQREREQLDSAKEAADSARAATVQDVTRLELDVNELRTRSVEDRHRRGRAEAELRRVEADIAASRDGLAHTQQELEVEQAREAELARRMAEGEKQRDALYQKQGQGKQFRNKRERDEWLRNDIRGIEQVMQKKQTQAEVLDSEIAVLRGEVGALEAAIEQRQRDVEKGQSELSRAEQAIAHARQQRDDKAAKRKQLMKQDDEMARDMKRAVEDRENATAMLDKTAPRDALRGINSLRQIVREHQIEGVHGPLLELIDCDELFQTAVEVTAGSSLYNVVVDTDAVAARLVRYLNERKGGRITFIPLNQARAPRVDYPDNSDTVPLISKLRYDLRFKNAFGQVFGRTLLCKDINVAADMARAGSFDCITIEGSRVERKGAMTGGHYDNKRSKLKLMRTIKESAGRLEQLQHNKNRVQTEINKVDQAVAKALGEVEKQEAQAAHVRNNVEHARREARDLKSQLTLKQQALEHKEKAVAGIREALEAHAADVAARQRELQSDMQAGLAAHEQAALERLLPELDALKKEHVRCRARRMEVEARLSAVETTLSENLLRRQDELQAELDTLQVASRGTELGGIEAELAAARAAADDALKEHKSVSDRIAAVEKELRSLKAAKDDLKRKEEECERVLQDEGKVLEGLLNERNLVHAKRDELNRKIRDLGVFPADAFDKYQRHSLKELHRMLHRCNESVKKFGHVNKKALDQYSTFTEQREEMRRRQRELDEGDEKIKELIKVLDQRKDEALERTFKQVARSFRETFAELVPGGTGSLVMVRKKADDDAMDDDDDDDGDRRDGDAGGSGRVDKYSGVRVKVSFTGRGETQSMRQLSGGQKTVVALSLIFAIQACDPAPFYLFDEIDAALDPQYRSAVANMIRGRADAAQPTQFIVTTFRPELVKVADKVYGVDHRNRVSTVKVVGLEAGLRFVEADQGPQTRD